MNFVTLLIGIAVLSLLSAGASYVCERLALPIPGPIVALLVLVAWCLWRGQSNQALDSASKSLTVILPLLIMPSSIGIMEHWALIKAEWLAVLVAILASLVFTLITTPYLVARIERSLSAADSKNTANTEGEPPCQP